ncbi:hypothetical protein TTHERM_000594179 (macronuclear) [Tetrahymena thermophila SB210]|uniref:Uncharacterized protein n=1 Tax=Tetrahymena thermophila (strain SB210) TaxID=312017 RepID=W7XFH5_TETTS|nr:hypothetical protein TTHERM_000594179 [Tetrahymena thermophila SB210]EWS75578.1 hypothetical protein TTHERM_000594179 [Tetrahymena thermophila SB210]|eukprot:XP_012651878.1 hypothetical protein TTHERM_000594179 [Tetrahymena thermophila SB210]
MTYLFSNVSLSFIQKRKTTDSQNSKIEIKWLSKGTHKLAKSCIFLRSKSLILEQLSPNKQYDVFSLTVTSLKAYQIAKLLEFQYSGQRSPSFLRILSIWKLQMSPYLSVTK